MKICMDGLSLYNMDGIGLNTYCYGLLENLFYAFPKEEYNLIWDNSPHINEWSKYECVKYAHMNINRIKDEYTNLEEFLKINKVDIYHSPNNGFSIPHNKICNYVVTVHDLLPIANSRYVDEKYKRKFDRVFPAILPKVDKFIAVSNFIKKELIAYFNIPENKIEVIYPTCYMPRDNAMQLHSKNLLKRNYGIHNEFILYIGSIHPRKNIKALITAFKDVVKYNKNINLVLVGKVDGKRYKYYEQLKVFINQMELEDKIKFTGSVPHSYIPYFLNECICQVNFPEYDGFPISVIEGMSQGVPLICSSHESIKELAYDSCMYVDIKDSVSVSNSILDVINNEKIRIKMSSKGIQRSKLFNSQKFTNQIVNLYKNLL